jgi:AraC-like DNA-binding protein
MYRFDTPERAIEMFERLHGLNVTVHDLAGTISSFLKPDRSFHRSALCRAVKAQGHLNACLQFENHQLRQDLAALPEGRVHVCHAGLVEWAVPIFEQDRLAWVIYAGPRLPGKHLPSAFRARLTRWPKPPWTKRELLPKPVEEDDAQMILEHLRQLAARLQKWVRESGLDRPARRGDVLPTDPRVTRQIAIHRFVEDNYQRTATLPELAKKLGLSESRTSHFVRESCGTSFRALLVRKRIQAATELLRQSDLSVLQIALATGFQDLAHFHRLFRRRVGITPARYRGSGRA